MKIQPYKTNNLKYKNFYTDVEAVKKCSTNYACKINIRAVNSNNTSFKGNPFSEIKKFAKFLQAKRRVLDLKKYVEITNCEKDFVLRDFAMEPFEGLQYGIKVFKNMTMKEIQYLCENLHVIAVNRGCKNMCGYCYADAKPSKRAMSWEDFTAITKGLKTLKKRFLGLDIFGENFQIARDDILYRTTELFYDSDCINLAVKDKKGKIYDFTELATELYNSTGRRTAFDTSGWYKNNSVLQKRAEKYANYFLKPENMEKLNAFNISFNVFNASYIASVKALKKGEAEKANRLRERFTDNMANSLFTFIQLADNPKFHILLRSFDSKGSNTKYFDKKAIKSLAEQVFSKVQRLCKDDLAGEQKYIKSSDMLGHKLVNLYFKLNLFDTSLNSSGRMKDFMKKFDIKAPLTEYDEPMKKVIADLKENGRYHEILMHRLIDADGKVYHMNYARFIPTEIQLNIKQKDIPAPKLANLINDFSVTKELLNRSEILIMKKAMRE